MDNIIVTKRCPKGHEKVQRTSGYWACNICHQARRHQLDAQRREAAGLPPKDIQPKKLLGDRCRKGHKRHQTPAGTWRCSECARLISEAKARASRIARGLSPEPALSYAQAKSEQRCKYGHPKVRAPSGKLYCASCNKKNYEDMAANAGKKLPAPGVARKRCAHYGKAGFDWVFTSEKEVVCMTCLVAAANKKKSGGKR